MLSDVWFGINESGISRDFETMRRLCLAAEDSGFDFFSIPDHFMDTGTGLGPPLECWTSLSGLAAVTNEIKLAPLVSCYAFREPTVLGRMATTIDIISGGRLIFGIGAGWHEHEFMGYMGRFPPASERLMGLEETVIVCKKMFKEESISHSGVLYQYENVLNSPPPVQKHVPILIGGGGERTTLKIAAKYADISHFHPWFGIDVVERKVKALKEHCKTVGRDYDEIRKGIGFALFLGRDREEIMAKVQKIRDAEGSRVESTKPGTEMIKLGTPDVIAEQLRNYIGMGFGCITLTFPPSNSPEDMNLFYEKVVPLL
ncbi:MAG: LLM class flavin-dependent oxidoreductase [Candidatus Thorarchaeota archaeon]|nr:MAG: LLM class flavin-dependent oxidoreductase [Candidatus Thorarchaeota archaeon]